ncbi:MAG: LysM peptidoglycan-binding domain-containing protein [Chloroflexota bacterium]|nr:LysM peptidoglycan-binding domain-containing protein [Anaerolineae bacterium]
MSRRAKLITLVLVLSILLTTAGVVVSADGEIWHIVKWGENLTKIAAMYGVTVEAIMTANGLTNPNLIYAGQKLLIPSSTPYITHIVQRGETLSSIAWLYGVNYWDIATLNGLANPNLIYVGQVLLIPTTGPVPTPTPPVPVVQEAIIISTPTSDATITSPVTVTGYGSAFENTLAVRVLDETGAVIGEGFAMVDAEFGQYGPFTGTVTYAAPATTQLGRIQVFSISMRDGATVHLASVTIMLRGS